MKEMWKLTLAFLLTAQFGVASLAACEPTSFRSSSSYYVEVPAISYYFVAPVAMSYAPSNASSDCQPVSYSQPTAAPSSADKTQSKEPPATTTKSAPNIIESRSQSAPSQSSLPSAPSDHCRVGFWNLTGADVNLQVEGKAHFVKKDGAIRLDVGRQFAWRMDEAESRAEIVPDDQNTREIVLRK